MSVTRRRAGWSLGLFVVLAVGCATLPPKKALAPGDFKAIAGEWTGRFDGAIPDGTKPIHVFVINQDGTFLERGPMISSGTVGIKEGEIVFAGTQTRGAVSLYEEGGDRYLIGEGQILVGPALHYTGLGNGRYAIRLKASR